MWADVPLDCLRRRSDCCAESWMGRSEWQDFNLRPSRAQWHREQQVNLLRGFFGTLCADFGPLCRFRSHIRDSAAKCESEEGTYLSGLVGAPEEIRTPDPQIRSLVLYPAELRARRVVAIGSDPQWQEAAKARTCRSPIPTRSAVVC